MKVTVADVKKYCGEGFEFVAGDKFATTLQGVESSFYKDVNKGLYLDCSVSKLAPRPNKGTQPVGDGVVVVVDYRDGDTETIAAGCLAYSGWKFKDSSADIISWKPCLKWIAEQVEKDSAVEINLTGTDNERMEQFMDMHKEASEKVKPVFTQAMADAGEFPPVGSVCMFSHDESPWRECFIVGMDQGGEDLVVQSYEYLFFSGDSVKFKPIKTDREKAIDACMAVGELRARDGAEEVYGRLYDAGLLKGSK